MEDIDLASKVNLKNATDFDVSADIYSSIIPKLKNNINNMENILPEKFLNNIDEEELNKFKLFKIDRKLIKKPVMTIPYSVSRFGIKLQLLELGKKIKINKKIFYKYEDIYGKDILIKSNVIYYLAYLIYITIQMEYPI